MRTVLVMFAVLALLSFSTSAVSANDSSGCQRYRPSTEALLLAEPATRHRGGV
jgi:hypothetical protein